MNSSQKKVLLIGVILAAVALMYVPWNYIDDDGERQSVGYGLITKPPVFNDGGAIDIFGLKIAVVNRERANEIDSARLALIVAVIVVVTGGLIIFFGNRQVAPKG